MLNLTHLGRGEGGALHQTALMRRFLSLGHDVRMIAPARGGDATIDPAIRQHVHFSPSVEKLRLPTSLDGLLQLVPLLIARLKGARVLYARANLFTVVQVLLARGLRMRVVVEHNSWTHGERLSRGGGKIAAWLDQCSQVWSAKLAHQSRCVTTGIAKLLENHGVDTSSLHVIGNGTDVAAWQVRSSVADYSQSVQLGFIGILSSWQGVETAIHALAELRRSGPFELTILGDGPEMTRLSELASSLALADAVHFHGYVDYRRAPELVANFDIALAPFTRKRNELIGLAPIKLRDYAAAGKPTVAAGLPGINELADGGWLFTHQPDDAADLARRVLQLYQMGPEELQRIGQLARAYAEANFDWDGLADRVLELC